MNSKFLYLNTEFYVKTFRLSLNDRSDLMIDGRQVAIVYFRAGYSPDHYPSTKG